MTAISSWYDVPLDLIYLLAKSPILDISDLIRIGVVCLSWRSMLIENHWFGCGPQLEALRISPHYAPKLMLAEADDSDGTREFFDVITKRTFRLQLDEARERRICGINDGWAITIGEDLEIHLLNLITRQRIELPSQLSFDDFGLEMTNAMAHSLHKSGDLFCHFIQKAMIIGSPCSAGGCTVVAIVCPGDGSRVAVLRLGVDKFWKVLMSGDYPTMDIFYKNDVLYGISNGVQPRLFVWNMCNITGEFPQEMKGIPLSLPIPPTVIFQDTFYLVEVAGELVCIGRMRDWRLKPNPFKHYRTSCVFVFKVINERGVEVKDLGDCCLFVGFNTSTALSPVPSGLKRNSIYFTDDHYHGDRFGGTDLGVYSLDDNEYSQFYTGNLIQSFSPPTWVTFNPVKV